jgi:tubulin polyglutamylase TTLL4
MFEEGLTRFATHKYSTNLKEVKKRFVHLTNFSVNKHSKHFITN